MGALVSPIGREQAARSRSAPPSLRLDRAAARTGARLGLTLVVLGATWWFLAPAQLGGRTTFTTVDGTSMLPTLEPSELVLLRRASAYRVGDVVGYRSTLLHRLVLHRIVAIHGGRYTFKGDNNSFTDPDHPTRGLLVGKRWLRIPAAGRAVGVLHVPAVVAALAAALVLVVGLGGRSPATTTEQDGRR